MHLDDERLQRLIDRELKPDDERAAREHVAMCTECRAVLATADREAARVRTMLRALDHPAPMAELSVVLGRASAEDRALLVRAAGLLLAFVLAAGAYAAPGSPVPRWLASVGEWLAQRGPGEESGTRAPQMETETSGISVAPGANLVIAFTSTQEAGGVRLSWSDGAEVVVQAPAGTATFTTEAERLVVDNHGSSAVFDVLIPRTAQHIQIEVRGITVFAKDGDRVTPQSVGGPTPLPLQAPR